MTATLPHATYRPVPDVRVTVRGAVDTGTADYAAARIAELITDDALPVLAARVRLTRYWEVAVTGPVIAQTNVDIDGWFVRAQASAPTGPDAVDRAVERLRERVVRVAELRGAGWGDKLRHSVRGRHELTIQRMVGAHRSVRSPSTIRTKRCLPVVCSVSDAAFDMDIRDYNFHLFTERESGRDSVLWRDGSGGTRLTQGSPSDRHRSRPAQDPVISGALDAPVISLSTAEHRLGAGRLPFIPFVDIDTKNVSVLYRRYDGHFGLLTALPATR
ncbi:sigma 54 modulation/S30EA ribosomal C-terminal domain-containing protein [Haloechinothrix sp. YIM 98757]|uniref:Sigma 54 modulation/S30EA ribosomal C-terminal domain-containing protein n=1 Tax=Haloechinothrix aidingensis TaxID=2752311 RepID=A0A838ACC1_9PSEU|nr:sigma 54 modulation/S30EA ribosomal C-terminal domain-containing protein [Haloechinothrix aidingensis]MBA0126873.1 sigma 54 modulation/S30EA ribosomal C-terminal domain-containing protein [Haloechinothrix aidingensis]